MILEQSLQGLPCHCSTLHFPKIAPLTSPISLVLPGDLDALSYLQVGYVPGLYDLSGLITAVTSGAWWQDAM